MKLFKRKLNGPIYLLAITFILLSLMWLIISNLIYKSEPIFTVRSIDTAKYSRDLAGQMLGDQSFERTITKQVQDISKTGANYIAIETPYDEQFLPFLRIWVKAVRGEKLNVWFRGNFSGWEGWYDYPKIDRATHLQKMHQFILNNPDLFADGDIFTPCPECENGGPGDPRTTGDIKGFRDFMYQEYLESQINFGKLGKKVLTNYNSMNYDVAALVMDKDTTQKFGGIVTIDHYVKNPLDLSRDVDKLAKQTGGKIVLGEFGAPIPDINGQMTIKQQAEWINQALKELAQNKNILGLNYWTSFGGSTALWDGPDQPRLAVSIIQEFYNLQKKVYPAFN
jgi:hypothetical protein